MTDSGRFDPARAEPAFKAPLVVVLLTLSMPALYLIQNQLPDRGLDWAFYPVLLRHGEWTGVFTSMLLHFNWAHVATNAVGALAFGTPVARVLKGPAGVAAFVGFYLAGGVAAALGFGLLHPNGVSPVIGASGAVFALIGAAVRLLGAHGAVRPFMDPAALRMAGVWMAVNVAVGLVGFAPGVEGARIAWEAHAVGLVVGYLAIGPLGRLFKAPRFASRSEVSDPES